MQLELANSLLASFFQHHRELNQFLVFVRGGRGTLAPPKDKIVYFVPDCIMQSGHLAVLNSVSWVMLLLIS